MHSVSNYRIIYSVHCGLVIGVIDIPDGHSDDGDLRASVDEVRWCQLNSGPTTVTDRNGRRHAVHVSVWRDGSVWARVGRSAMDWTTVDERRRRIQTALLDDDAVAALQVLPYSDYCTLTDIRLQLRIRAGWSPSYVVLIDAARSRNRETHIVSVRNARGDCRFNTTLTLSADKQRLVCDAGPTNNCGMRNVPSRRSQSPAADAASGPDAWFIKYVSMDLYGADHWYCSGREQLNGYTFTGSYYYAYVKMAFCPVPTGWLLINIIGLIRIPELGKPRISNYISSYDEKISYH